MGFNHVDLDKPTLLLIDTSVALHRFSQSYAGLHHSDPLFIPLLKANMVALAQASWLPWEIVETVRSTIFTVDTKRDGKYWRHDYLLDPSNYLQVKRRTKVAERARVDGLHQLAYSGTVDPAIHDRLAIKYKAGRSLPDYRFKKVKGNALKWLESGALGSACIGQPYYESDDVMAAIVAMNRAKGSPYNLILYTVDCDLMGLIDPSVTWVCMAGFQPPVRDTLAVCNTWAEALDANAKPKLGTLTTWRDVWEHKSRLGDKSDNIPASDGVLLPVIDLIDPPSEHKLWDRMDIRAGINSAIHNGTSPDPLEAHRAVHYILSKGCVPCFKTYTDFTVNPILSKIS